MDPEAVVKFLSQVPLLQRLPSASVRRIAEVVEVKRYDPGDHVIREEETGNGIYFIWEGEAEVSGPNNAEDEHRTEYQLKQYDYFAPGTQGSNCYVNVTALTKLTCLVLHHTHKILLQPKSIWNSDETPDNYSLVEHILHLEPLEVNMFRGFSLPGSPQFQQVFGGQFIGQALAAASKTVDCLKLVHSMHAYFILTGDKELPIIYQVHRLRDGNSFATRRVDATQRGVVIFTLLASFKSEESGLEHQVAAMPNVSLPEMLLSLDEIRERRMIDPRLPMQYRNTVAREDFVPWPIEIRFCESDNPTVRYTSPIVRYWFKTRGKLSDDPALHRKLGGSAFGVPSDECVVAYASDLIFLQSSVNPHRRKGLKARSLSLDHSIWFHREVRADDWLLYDIESPSASSGRGFCTGRMFNQKGELIATLIQEGLIREIKPQNQRAKSRL